MRRSDHGETDVTFYGADTEQLMTLSRRMQMSMLTLQDVQGRIMRSTMTVDWQGPDADEFRATAQSVAGTQLSEVTEDLVRRSEELHEHAAEQDDASDPRGMWEKINDFLHVPAEMTRFARDVQKLIQNPKKMMDMFRRYPELRDAYKDLKNLDELFPGISRAERTLLRKEWFDELTGKGWEKLGDFIPQKISKYTGINIPGKEWAGKTLAHLDEITDATKPWVKIGSKSLGKLVPGLDIGLGVHQMLDSDSTGYDRFSGGLSVASGSLMLLAPLTGPAAPIVAGVSIGLGVVSAGMDLGKMAYENIPVVKDAVDSTVDFAKDVGSAIGDGLSNVGKAFGSLFG